MIDGGNSGGFQKSHKTHLNLHSGGGLRTQTVQPETVCLRNRLRTVLHTSMKQAVAGPPVLMMSVIFSSQKMSRSSFCGPRGGERRDSVRALEGDFRRAARTCLRCRADWIPSLFTWDTDTDTAISVTLLHVLDARRKRTVETSSAPFKHPCI